MSDAVQANIGCIQELEAAYARFCRVHSECLPEVKRELRQVTEAMDDAVKDLRREVARLTECIASADRSEDASWATSRLNEVEEELELATRCRRQLAAAAADYERQARRIEQMAMEHRVGSREFLRGAVDDLKAYVAKTADGVTQGTASAMPGGGGGAATASSAHAEGEIDLTDCSLPKGFVWVPIDQIDCSVETGGFANADKFEKGVTREEMIRGFDSLRRQILPALAAHEAHGDSSWCARLDTEAARTYEEGIQRPFDAFFGDSHIYLTRKNGTEPFDVTNGRHRILIARELGWKAIPARVHQG